LTSPFLFFGWIWSIYWGYLIYLKSQQEDIAQDPRRYQAGSAGSRAASGQVQDGGNGPRGPNFNQRGPQGNQFEL